MKYSITIKGETKAEIGDCLYVFPQAKESPNIDDLQKYCNYEEKIITAIKPMLHQNIDWNGAIKFEYLCGTHAYYSDKIMHFFKEGSFQQVYYSKEDAEKESKQRIEAITKKLSGLNL